MVGLHTVFIQLVADWYIYNGTGPGYSVGQDDWVDCVNYAVPHYGLKWGLDSRSTNLTQTLYFGARAKYTVWFKNAH